MVRLGLYQALENRPDLLAQEILGGTAVDVGLGILYLASYLEKFHSFTNTVIEPNNLENLLAQKPDLIGISAYTNSINQARTSARLIKEKMNIPVFLGGPHITLLPYSLPVEFDFAVVGEGEETLAQLVKLYEEKGEFTPDKLAEIKGLVYWDKEKKNLTLTEERPLLQPLDSLPNPKRELIGYDLLIPRIITSRGCPHACLFCASRSYWKKFRYFSTEYIINELSNLVKKSEKFYMVYIDDDTFLTPLSRFKEICSEIIERQINKRIAFYCNVRADLFTEEVCSLLKQINVSEIFFGAESGSDRILRYYNKKTTIEDNQRVLDLCQSYDLKAKASFIIGAPFETEEDLLLTYKFIEKNKDKLYFLEVLPLEALPGTEIWEHAKKRGLVHDRQQSHKIIYLNEMMPLEKFNYYYDLLKVVGWEINSKYNYWKILMNDIVNYNIPLF